MNIQAILFDLYGTLISRQERHFLKQISKYHIRQLLEGKTAGKLGTIVLDIKQKLLTTDLSTHAIPQEFLSLFSRKPDEQFADLERELREALLAECSTTTLLSGAKTMLSFFKKRGYGIGVVSNVSTYHKEPFFRFGLDHLVDVVVFSCDIRLAKPEPEMYLKAIRQLGVTPEEVVFVGDSYNMDVKMPLSLGMKAIHISPSERYKHHINDISEMGLIILHDNIYNIKHFINGTKSFIDRAITLHTFTLLENHDDQESIVYRCSGSQNGERREFYLKRYLRPPSTYSNHGDIPVEIGSEVLLLIPCGPQEQLPANLAT